MPQRSKLQYQVLANPTLGGVIATQFFESAWHQPWSEPVRFRVIHTSQIVSGGTWNPQQPLPPTSLWYANLSEPVRFRVIHTSGIVSGGTWNPQQPLPPTSLWYANLSEPVRLPKGLRSWYQQFECDDAIPNPEPEHFSDAWVPQFTLPVWHLRGLRAWNHPFLFQPERVLPTPDITVTISATETSVDVYSEGIQVYEVADTARVSIEEIAANNDAAASIRE